MNQGHVILFGITTKAPIHTLGCCGSWEVWKIFRTSPWEGLSKKYVYNMYKYIYICVVIYFRFLMFFVRSFVVIEVEKNYNNTSFKQYMSVVYVYWSESFPSQDANALHQQDANALMTKFLRPVLASHPKPTHLKLGRGFCIPNYIPSSSSSLYIWNQDILPTGSLVPNI